MPYSIQIDEDLWIKHTQKGRSVFAQNTPITDDPHLARIFTRFLDAEIQYRDVRAVFYPHTITLIAKYPIVVNLVCQMHKFCLTDLNENHRGELT